MMDELELLKKDWQAKDEHLPKLSYNDIYTMIWKKSSSIVKWILIISILEFVIPHLLYLIPGMSKSMQTYEDLGIKNISYTLWIASYLVIFYFIYQFYRRYKEISTLDNSKELMRKIINRPGSKGRHIIFRTRKTVKYYVIFSLSMLFLTCVLITVGMYLSDNLIEIFAPENETPNIEPEKLKMIMIGSMAIFSIVFIAIMGGIYYLLYGLLLRKLNRNYKELKKLEI